MKPNPRVSSQVFQRRSQTHGVPSQEFRWKKARKRTGRPNQLIHGRFQTHGAAPNQKHTDPKPSKSTILEDPKTLKHNCLRVDFPSTRCCGLTMDVSFFASVHLRAYSDNGSRASHSVFGDTQLWRYHAPPCDPPLLPFGRSPKSTS